MPPPPRSPHSDTLFPLHVIIVEGDDNIVEQAWQQLGALGIMATRVTSKRQAEEIMAQQKVDGAMLDWDSDLGRQTAKLLRSSSSSNKAIVAKLTSSPHVSPSATQRQLAYNQILKRPLTEDQMNEAITQMHEPMLQERRRYHRVTDAGEAVCIWPNHSVKGAIVNLSASGLLLSAKPNPTLGSSVSLFLALNGGHAPLVTQGRVVRTAGPNQVGIQFDGLSRSLEQKLMTFVDARASTAV